MADSLSSITGISSGIDYKSLVDQIIRLDHRQADAMQATVDGITKKKDALSQFRTALETLRTSAVALRDGTAFDAFTTTATGQDATGKNVLTAVGVAGAATGTYGVTVTALAAAQKTVGTVGFNGDPLTFAGKFTLKGETVDIASGDTIGAVRDKINALTAKTGVQATLVSGAADGSDQRLVLTSTKSGTANAFTLTDDPTDATDVVAALGLNVAPTTPAADAALTIDGIPVTRSGNAISDAIPGVTLNLATLGTSTVSVERTTSAAANAMKGFVDAYNAVKALVDKQGGKGGALVNDPMLRAARSELARNVLLEAPTTDATTGAATGVAADLSTLASLGVSLAKDGTLTFDSAKFGAAYPSRLDELKATLADRMGGVATYADSLTATLTGAIAERTQGLDDTSLRLTARIADVDARLDKKRSSLLAQYAKFEASLGRLQSLQSSMSAQFTSLTKSNNDG
jgi:flagellar hook-associated protein 2